MTKRSVATVIVLTIITCGIYGWYWLYTTSNELHLVSGTKTVDPVVSLLLAIFLGSVGYAIFGYDSAVCIDKINENRNVSSDNKIAYILLGFIIPIVLIGILQNEINRSF